MSNPGVTTLAAVRDAARQRADMETSQFVSNGEFNGYINASYQELYGLLVQKFGDNYYVALDANKAPYQFVTSGSAEMYGLPDGSSSFLMPDGTAAPGFFKLLGVEMMVSAPFDWTTLKPFPLIERNRYTVQGMQTNTGRRSYLRYALMGGNLWFKPVPMAGQTIRIWYVPRLALLTGDQSTLDGVSGWEEYIVIDAAIKALQKEESDVSVLMAQKQAMIARIEAEAENRDAGSPMVVGDARGTGFSTEDYEDGGLY